MSDNLLRQFPALIELPETRPLGVTSKRWERVKGLIELADVLEAAKTVEEEAARRAPPHSIERACRLCTREGIQDRLIGVLRRIAELRGQDPGQIRWVNDYEEQLLRIPQHNRAAVRKTVANASLGLVQFDS